MNVDISSLTQLVTAFRAETAANSITPETLGSLLQQIVNAIGAIAQASQGNTNGSNVADLVNQNSAKIVELTTSVNELKVSDRNTSAVAKGFYRYNKIDDLKTTLDVGMYILNSTGKFGTIGMYGILLVTANYAPWIQQYYFGCLVPTDWSGDAFKANIYTRTLYEGNWSQWKMFGT